MHKIKFFQPLLIRILIIAALISQQIALPLEALASAAHSPASLMRGRSEELDTYLARIAATQPELFQQAALAAVQDAFNGNLPASAGDRAMEEQIAHYLQLAANGTALDSSSPQSTSPQSATSSAIDGDTYRWNSSQSDSSGQAGSYWQMTARPGADPKLFASQFEELMTTDLLPAGLPSEETAKITTPLSDGDAADSFVTDLTASELSLLGAATEPVEKSVAGVQNVLPIAEENQAVTLEAATLEAQQAMSTILRQVGSSISQNAAKLGQIRLQNSNRAAVQTAAQRPVIQATQSAEADLAVSVTAPATAEYGEVITYTFAVTNYGPSAAATVQLTQTLPANGVYTHTVAACSALEEQVVCDLGALGNSANKTITVAVQMKGNDTVTSTVIVADNGGTTDPGGQSASVEASTTITSSTRSERAVGNVVIAANEFITVAGQVEASGAVEIGYLKDGITSTFHLRLGADDSLSWLAGQEAINGEGTVFQILKSFELFKGGFTIDGEKKDPLLLPSAEITSTIKKLGGFALVGKGTITQVTVLTGTASVSATIKLSQPGVVSDTEQALVASINPGGKVEGTIAKFAMTFSGLKIEVDKATFGDDSIQVKQAKLTMPDTFGKLSGVLSEMVLKSNSISFGGVGVKIPIPDLYPVGKPMTATVVVSPTSGLSETVTVTPTVALVKNSATVGVNKGKFVLQVEGTLQLWLPGNQRNIPIEFKIDDSGQLEGSVKEITLSIAGQDLSMKQVEISNKGLKVQEASLTIQGSGDKEKPAPAKVVQSRAEKTDKKEPDKKFTVIVKNVVIDGNGLAIGGAGITNYLPDIKIGTSATFTKLEFTVVVNDPTGKASFELAIKGKLKIHIENNEQTIEFSAKMDKKGLFSGKVKELSLTIAKSTLKMEEMEFDDKGFAAKSATLTLPEVLKSTTVTINQVKIDEQGLSFGDANVKIPVEFILGKEDSSNNFAVKGELSLILAQDRTYGFAVEGTVTIKLAAQTAEATGAFRLDSTGAMRGSVDSFKLTIAGLELAIKSASIEDGVLKANEATLSIPKEWGGLSTSVYHIQISENDFSIGGGSFKLPEIKVGDMLLSLEGTLKKESGGYIIGAGGSLKMPNVGGNGCSGLGVAVEIFASNSRGVVMKIQPLSAASADALSLQLRKISVSLQCTIPLGASGFDLTAVAGTLTLSENVTKIEIKVTMESKLRVGPFNILTATGDMGVEYVKNPYKFEIGIGASMKIFSMFEAARARASMRFTDGAVPFLFKAEMNIDAVIAKGEVKLAAWTKDGSFYLTGRIYGQVGVRKGAAGEHCWSIRVPIGWRLWRDDNWQEVRTCVPIPPTDLFISATMEFGKFQRGDGDAWGFKAGINILGKNYGIYVDSAGGFNVGNVDEYKLVDTPTLQRARQLQAMVASAGFDPASLSQEDRALLEDYHFAGEEITIDVATITRPGDLGVTILRSVMDADVIVTLLRPDGLGITGSNPPSNVTFREGYLSFDNITDQTTGKPITADTVLPTIQTFMNVTAAELGDWRIMLSRQPTADFIIYVDGTVYGPPVEKLSLANQHDADNLVNLTWTQTAQLTSTVSIYATQDTITSTASYTETQVLTDANGVSASQVMTVDLGEVTQFGGFPLAEFSYLAGKKTLTESVDLSFLRSGTYNLWLEVDDGENPPMRRYFPSTATVWHAWAESWQGDVTVTPELGGLTVAWDENLNPDVDGYEIEVTAEGDTTDEDSFFLDVGQSLSQTVSGLSANQVYSVTIIAYDSGTGRNATSERISATPLAAPFNFSAAAVPTVAGGSVANVVLTLSSAVNPYPDWVYLDFVNVPEGFDLALTTAIVTPTTAGVQAGLLLTPLATLPGGVYTVTLSASASGDVKQVQIPITVQEPSFALQSNKNSLTLYPGEGVSVDLNATYQFGESDAIDVDLDQLPAGVDWGFAKASFLPGEKATLILTATEYLPYGSDEVTIVGSDYEHESKLTLPLTVAGFELASDWDSWAIENGGQATYTVNLTGAAWTDPVTLNFDAASLANHFATQLSSPTANVPATIDAQVTVLPNTPPGIYELLLYASSRGLTETLPLYLTVQDDATATDLQMRYLPSDPATIAIAGEVYSYTLKPRNISDNPGLDVAMVDTTIGSDFLTLVEDGNCAVQEIGDETDLTCAVGDLAAASEDAGTIISWQVAADAPAGEILTHLGEVFAQGAMYSETSTLDNSAALEVEIVRLADLQAQTQASAAVAGAVLTMTTTVSNAGPSYADGSSVEIFLPAGVSLESAAPGCVQNVESITCAVGTLAPGQSAIITTIVQLVPDYRDDLETLVVANSESDDPDFNNNYEFVFSDVGSDAKLTVAITPNRNAAVEGETVDYRIAVTNHGPSQATAVGVGLTMPDSSDIVNVQIGDVTQSLDHLVIDPGKTLTITAAILFIEDSDGQPVLIDIEADARESAIVHASNQSLTVSNANPSAVLSNTLSVNEGERGILTVHVDDAGASDALTIQWDLDNDGLFDDGDSGIVLFDARSLDGPTTRPIAVRVGDDDGGQVEVAGMVTVQDVAPTVDAGADQYRPYDEAFTIDFDFVDPFASDTHSLKIDWGNGEIETLPLLARTNLQQISHTYNQIGKFAVNVCVRDDDGKVGCDQVRVQAACQEHGLVARFNNVGSQISIRLENASGDIAIPAGLPLTLYDGNTVLKTFTLAQALPVGGSHTLDYTWLGTLPETYTLRLAVDDNGSGVKSTSLCSGTVEQLVHVFKVYLPVIGNENRTNDGRDGVVRVYLPYVNGQ